MIKSIKRIVKNLLRYPVDLLLATSKDFPWHVLRALDPQAFRIDPQLVKIKLGPSVSARFRPLYESADTWRIEAPGPAEEVDPDDDLPIPPQHLWAGYCETPQEYVNSGREHFESMKQILHHAGFEFASGQKILDFGCAAGRMTRQLHPYAQGSEIWGVDQSNPHILWCQQHLSPSFRFLTSTTFPHLPFEDNTFDLIFSGSVFTHIGDLEDAWLMELRRITRPNGLLYITVADNHTMEILRTSPPGHWLHDSDIRRQLLDLEKGETTAFQLMGTMRESGNSQVFHDRNYIQGHWGQYMEILSISPEAYGYQTAVTMRKS